MQDQLYTNTLVKKIPFSVWTFSRPIRVNSTKIMRNKRGITFKKHLIISIVCKTLEITVNVTFICIRNYSFKKLSLLLTPTSSKTRHTSTCSEQNMDWNKSSHLFHTQGHTPLCTHSLHRDRNLYTSLARIL